MEIALRRNPARRARIPAHHGINGRGPADQARPPLAATGSEVSKLPPGIGAAIRVRHVLAALLLALVGIALAALIVPGKVLLLPLAALGVLALVLVLRPAASDPALAQLQRDKDAAEAASAAKSRYLASVSHEIRSPLNAIYGYAQLLERGSSTDPHEAARVIRRSAEHLTDLVEGLLDISLVEHGRMQVSSDVVRLPAFLDQIARMFAPAAAARGLEFRRETHGMLPEFVRTDQKRLRQVLINLLSNAIKFTPSGSVTLSAAWSGQIATFEVRDTGPGIAADAREAIFAPFERGEHAGGDIAGVGLGLPITRALVQMLGGEIALESSDGGSCFRVRLMLGEVAGHREAGAAPGRVIGYEGPRRSILVMDDDARQLAFVRQLLEECGFDVAAAPDGETAIALCAARTFDLALLDIAMAGPSGWQTAATLRAAHGPAMKLVMLSANAHERHGHNAGQQPPHDLFLLKPVEIDELIAALGDQLNLTWQRESAPPPATLPSGETPRLPSEAAPHIERLRDMLKIGHVRGIEAEIRAIDALQGSASTLAARLYDCLDRFDLAAMSRAIEGC